MGLTHHGDKISNSPNNALLEYQNNLKIFYPLNEASSSEKILVILYKSPISDKDYPETHLKEKAFYKILTIFANKDFRLFLLSSLFLATNAYLISLVYCVIRVLTNLNWLSLFSK